jgi:hypothetical protein
MKFPPVRTCGDNDADVLLNGGQLQRALQVTALGYGYGYVCSNWFTQNSLTPLCAPVFLGPTPLHIWSVIKVNM